MIRRIEFIRRYIYCGRLRGGTWRALGLGILLASTALANNAKISPDLQSVLSNPAAKVNVIVQYNSHLPCSGVVGSTSCPFVNLLGGVVNQVFSLINAVAGTVATGDVVFTLNSTSYRSVLLNSQGYAEIDPNSPPPGSYTLKAAY